MGLIRLMGKPENLFSFEDYTNEFTRQVTDRLHGRFTRLNILFDQYQDNSNKSATRTKRQTTICQVLTNITSRDVKLPFNWLKFIEINENNVIWHSSSQMNL